MYCKKVMSHVKYIREKNKNIEEKIFFYGNIKTVEKVK